MSKEHLSFSEEKRQNELAYQGVLGKLGFSKSLGDGNLSTASWKDLHEERKTGRRAMQAIVDRAKQEDRDLSEEESYTFDRLSDLVANLTDALDRRAESGNRDVHPGARALPAAGLPGASASGTRRRRARDRVNQLLESALAPNERVADTIDTPAWAEDFGIGDLLQASVNGQMADLPPEMVAAMGISSGPGGGFVVPGPLMGTLIDLSRAKSRVIEAGAMTILVDAPGAVFPVLEQDPTVHVVAENHSIPESDVVFSEVSFKPIVLAAMVRISEQLMRDGAGIGAIIEQAMSDELARKLDELCLYNPGTPAGPLGLLSHDAVQEIEAGANGAELTSYDLLSQAVERVANYNAEAGDFLLSSRTWGQLDRLQDVDNNPLRAPRSVSERNLLVTNQIPNDMTQGSADNASAIITGQWSDYYIVVRQGIRIEVGNMNDAFSKLQYMIRGYMRVQAFAVRPEHFCRIVGIIPGS